MFWVQLVVVLAVLGGIAWVAAGRGGGISPAYSDRPDLALPPSAPLNRSDVDGVRFTVGLRGYRMDEVDEVLDRLAFEIAERDAYIAELRGPEAGVPEQTPADTEITGATGTAEAAEAAEPTEPSQSNTGTAATDGTVTAAADATAATNSTAAVDSTAGDSTAAGTDADD